MHISTKLKVWGFSLIGMSVIAFTFVFQRLANPPGQGEDYFYVFMEEHFAFLGFLCGMSIISGCVLLGLGCVSDQTHRRIPPSAEERNETNDPPVSQ